MEQIGKVISLQGERVTLEVKRMSACGSSCESCHNTCEQKSEFVSLPNIVNAKIGDFVEIHSDTNYVLWSMAKVYGIPLIFFISFILLFSYLKFSQLFSLLMGILSFVLSFLLLRLLDKKEGKKEMLEITRIL